MSEEFDNPTGTRKVKNVVGGFHVMLPGTWAVVPMTSREAVKSRVAAVVRRQMPAGDRLARLRRDGRDQLLESAYGALEAGATFFALALELLPGLPFGASILSYTPGWSPTAPARDDGVEGRLLRMVPGARVVKHPEGSLVRTTDISTQKPGEKEIRSLGLQYWFASEERDPTCFMVSVPFCPDDDLFIELFDSVIDSVRWAHPSQAGEDERKETE